MICYPDQRGMWIYFFLVALCIVVNIDILCCWWFVGAGGAATCRERGGTWEAEGGAWEIWTVTRRSQASTETRSQCVRWRIFAAAEVHSASADSSSCHYAVGVPVLAALNRTLTIYHNCSSRLLWQLSVALCQKTQHFEILETPLSALNAKWKLKLTKACDL